MDVFELNRRVQENLNSFRLRLFIARYLDSNPMIILNYQFEQIFKHSIGADNVPLGFYSRNRGRGKREGDPYTMIKTGLFASKIYLKVSTRSMVISSNVSYLDRIEDRIMSDQLFGLTDENAELLMKNKIKPVVRKWIRGVFDLE
jgi:hypothetical protein